MENPQGDINPFQSPTASRMHADGFSQSDMPQPRPVIPYESAGTRAIFAQLGLAVMAMVTLVSIFNDYRLSEFLGRVIALRPFTKTEGVELDQVANITAGVQLLCLIPTAIAFGMWVHRTYRNLPALGVRWLAGSPAFAVGGFYIPFANYYYSYSAIREIWNGSDPNRPAMFGPPNQFSPPVFGWWLLYFGAEVIRIGARILLISGVHSKDLSGMSQGVMIDQVANVMRLLAAAAIIIIINLATRRQNRRHELFLLAQADASEPYLAERADGLDQPWMNIPPIG